MKRISETTVQKQRAEGQEQTLEEMRSSHTSWKIRMPQTKVGTAKHDQIVGSGTNASNVQWGSRLLFGRICH